MSGKMMAALIGAEIALVGGIIGAFLQHFLFLRGERKKLEWQAEKKETQELRQGLLDITLSPGLSPATTGQLGQWSRLVLAHQSAAIAAGQTALMAQVEREQQASEERQQEELDTALRDHIGKIMEHWTEIYKMQMQMINSTQQYR
jgi:hypothetical protein